jgi:hypothetical protein
MRLHWLNSQLSVTFADYHTLSRVQSLHFTLRNSPRTYSANSLLKTATKQLTRRTGPYNWLLKTDCLDISVPLIDPQSYEWHCCLLPGHCVYRRCLGNEYAVLWRHRVLLCSSARCSAARHGTEQTPLPLLRRSVYSVARRLAVGYLATLCCVIQQRVDMSHYIKTCVGHGSRAV